MAANLEILIPFVPFFFSSILYILITTCINIAFSFRYWNNKSETLKAIVLIHLPPPSGVLLLIHMSGSSRNMPFTETSSLAYTLMHIL